MSLAPAPEEMSVYQSAEARFEVAAKKLGLEQGTTQIGFDLLANMGSEFWPDVKKKILRRKR